MISAKLVGLDDVIEKVRSLPSTIGVESAFGDAGRRLEAILRERTPPGYNRKLPDSVVFEQADDGFTVGYETGVETAGSDSVTRPRTSGRSVVARKRRWVGADELETILEETVDESADEIGSVIERSIANGLS